ncbi:hypothetical protein Phum_PHUM509010 [Pediculus humanus corporis]|uniref:Uncharacterized protein n=1 Tax=Pediculus humanus subsp. corporis TaxID=121224 RepID=E0VY31_PEDHC|nr:uncharacterized protein Phum_PHUM509010 [Pediculus humanus corporis]EEB18287.1 hypothetical protein Phum_PHUM509010 [Pediculus humanus corporis]
MQIISSSQNSEMGVHKTAEHESGYFEDDDEEEEEEEEEKDEGGNPAQLTPEQIRAANDVVAAVESGTRGHRNGLSRTDSNEKNGSRFSPVCLDDDCWCFEGRAGHKGRKKKTNI